MSSLARRMQIRMMKASGMSKVDKPVVEKGLDGRPRIARYDRVVMDSDGNEFGKSWPRAIPAQFRQPSNLKARDLIARLAREAKRQPLAA